ncbi:hypothetical protein BCR33DRAFT_325749 [Rhizoclosmatium globosum]|uniref:RRM domain-containing protein n=1 Tax=Rhizoclosmatium globosum TaxID=329046 RepID=A0A1Y2D091_9FUNG|nr:hypothetical protein BCR33DRAFT_325749 [Rhizoclosmatium globosum]|eukprot:ORY52693.1 hypothetical protein BCR33DRAFT_325749 [Rhizoclosmatium globosum]
MSATVKVSNISPLVSAETLRELFAHLGTIESIQDLGASQFSANTKEALVTFEDASAAEIAMHLTGTELGDKMLLVTSHAAVVSPAVSLPLALAPHPIQPIQPIIHSTSLIGNALGQGVPGTNIKNPYVTPQLYTVDPVKADEIGRTIYVGNISLLISEADLTQMFSACGPVTFIKMAGDPAHGCRFAFVEFAVVEAANEAISLHGTTLAERPLKVTYSKNAINKGPKALDDTTMRRVREAELRILNKDRNLGGNATVSWCAGDIPPARRPRSRSRSRSYGEFCRVFTEGFAILDNERKQFDVYDRKLMPTNNNLIQTVVETDLRPDVEDAHVPVLLTVTDDDLDLDPDHQV